MKNNCTSESKILLEKSQPEAQPRLLLIDDDPMIVRMYCRVLSRKYHHVLTALCPLEGEQMIFDHKHPLIVISDLEMKPLTGPQIAQRTHEHRLKHRIPMIINTGAYDQEMDNLQILQEKGVINSFHNKLEVDDLQKTIATLIQQVHHQTNRHH